MGPELRAALRILHLAWEAGFLVWGEREILASAEPGDQDAIAAAWQLVGRAIEGHVPGDTVHK